MEMYVLPFKISGSNVLILVLHFSMIYGNDMSLVMQYFFKVMFKVLLLPVVKATPASHFAQTCPRSESKDVESGKGEKTRKGL